MATAIDWLDAYRAASFSIVEMYAFDGALEYACGAAKTLHGRSAITASMKDLPASFSTCGLRASGLS